MSRYKSCKRKTIYSCLVGILAAVAIVFIAGKGVLFTRQTEVVTDYHVGTPTGDKMYYGVKGVDPKDEIPKFRSSAKFKILEIVPARPLANIGYGIKGEEPINLNQKISKSDWDNYIQQATGSKTGESSSDVKPLQFEGEGLNPTEGMVVNNSMFVKTTLKYALELSDDEVNNYIKDKSVDVLVVEPKQINADLSLISEADFIYIHNEYDKNENPDFVQKLVYIYNKYGVKKETIDKPMFKDGGLDISWDVVKALFEYSCIQEMPLTIQGCAFDQNILSNFHRLGRLLSVYNHYRNEFAEFSADFLYSEMSNSDFPSKCFGTGWSYESIAEDIVKIFNDGKADSHKNALEEYKTKVNISDFLGSYDSTTVVSTQHGGGDGESIILKLGNPNTVTDINKITHLPEFEGKTASEIPSNLNNTIDTSITILNSLKPVFHVLDVEPDNAFTLSTSKIAEWLPKEVKSKPLVTHVTMSQFVGMVNDLNADYDAIYFGSNMNKMADTSGKMYYTGLDAENNELKTNGYESQNGTDFLYSGNDITLNMVQKVRAFIEAKYPVIYDGKLLNISTDTNMYDKLINVEKGNMYKADGTSLKNADGTPRKLDLASVDHGKATVKFVSNKIADGKLQINFKTRYGKDCNYRAYLYIDTNHDGIYNVWENTAGLTLSNDFEKSVASKEFEVKSGNVGVNKNTKTISVNLSSIPEEAKLGTLSWKLEVVKLEGGNVTGIRSAIYDDVYHIEKKHTINVLHLGDVGSFKISEQSKFNTYIAKSEVKTDFDINLTDQEIDDTLSEINIENYEVIVVGFVNESKMLNNESALIALIKKAAAKGKGVIFTKDAISYFNNLKDSSHWGAKTNEAFRKLVGMDRFKVFDDTTIESSKMGFTYSVLNKFSTKDYFGGIEKKFVKADAIQKVNTAKITKYPYEIGNDSSGFSTGSGVYQLDLEKNDTTNVLGVAYYCLDNTNPSVTNYSVSPKDVRNNYYLWRYDNVFYSGITRDSFNCDNEVKLFINTIISSYGLQRGIYVNVHDLSSAAMSGDLTAYYLYADTDFDDTTLNGSKDVYFTVTKKGVSSSRAKVHFYLADQNGNKVLDPVASTPTSPKYVELTTTVAGGSKVLPQGGEAGATVSGSDNNEILFGKKYKFNYPYKHLLGDDAATRCNVIIEVEADGAPDVTDSAYVKVLRRAMFDLD